MAQRKNEISTINHNLWIKFLQEDYTRVAQWLALAKTANRDLWIKSLRVAQPSALVKTAEMDLKQIQEIVQIQEQLDTIFDQLKIKKPVSVETDAKFNLTFAKTQGKKLRGNEAAPEQAFYKKQIELLLANANIWLENYKLVFNNNVPQKKTENKQALLNAQYARVLSSDHRLFSKNTIVFKQNARKLNVITANIEQIGEFSRHGNSTSGRGLGVETDAAYRARIKQIAQHLHRNSMAEPTSDAIHVLSLAESSVVATQKLKQLGWGTILSAPTNRKAGSVFNEQPYGSSVITYLYLGNLGENKKDLLESVKKASIEATEITRKKLANNASEEEKSIILNPKDHEDSQATRQVLLDLRSLRVPVMVNGAHFKMFPKKKEFISTETVLCENINHALEEKCLFLSSGDFNRSARADTSKYAPSLKAQNISKNVPQNAEILLYAAAPSSIGANKLKGHSASTTYGQRDLTIVAKPLGGSIEEYNCEVNYGRMPVLANYKEILTEEEVHTFFDNENEAKARVYDRQKINPFVAVKAFPINKANYDFLNQRVLDIAKQPNANTNAVKHMSSQPPLRSAQPNADTDAAKHMSIVVEKKEQSSPPEPKKNAIAP